MPKKSVISLCVSALLAACAVTPPPPSPTATAAAVTPSPSAPRLVSPTPAGSLTTNLRVWLPPQYAPDDSAAGGKVLAEQIARFEQTHPGQAVEIRIKSVSGPGGLLESLATAYNAAPAVLPDVVALDKTTFSINSFLPLTRSTSLKIDIGRYGIYSSFFLARRSYELLLQNFLKNTPLF